MYRVVFSEKAKRQIRKLPKEIQERVGQFIERIKIRPRSFVKKLIGLKYFRGKVGNYRVILDIKDKILVVIVVEIGHRKNIYKS